MRRWIDYPLARVYTVRVLACLQALELGVQPVRNDAGIGVGFIRATSVLQDSELGTYELQWNSRITDTYITDIGYSGYIFQSQSSGIMEISIAYTGYRL